MSRLFNLTKIFIPLLNNINTANIQKCPLRCMCSAKALKATTTEEESSTTKKALMEFFDDPKNWGENEVKVGRSWKLEELRIKSNEDLHKLWFVLLKERNMLYTMEEECKQQTRLFPSPERIDKVQESMMNLESIVKERNEAYYMLETGETSLRSRYKIRNALGLTVWRKTKEYIIPKFMNTKWRDNEYIGFEGSAVKKFLKHYREQRYLEKLKQKRRDRGHVRSLFRLYKNVDEEALKEQFPHIDIEKEKQHPRSQGHFIRDD